MVLPQFREACLNHVLKISLLFEENINENQRSFFDEADQTLPGHLSAG